MTTRKTRTPEERQLRRLQRLRDEGAERGMGNAQVQLMLYQHEQVQRTINALLARWANEMLAMIVDRQDIPHDH